MAGTKQRWKRDPDRWRLRVDVGVGPDGQRRRITKVIEAPWTQEAERDVVDVELAKMNLEAAIMRARPNALANITVTQLVDRFLETRSQRVEYATTVFYRRHLAYAVEWIGPLRVVDVTPLTLDHLYETLRGLKHETGPKKGQRRHSDHSILKIHRSLKACFNQARRWQIITFPPTAGVDSPRAEDPEIDVPDPEVLVAALDELAELDPAMWCFAALTAWTGARRQSICGLTRDRIDFGDGEIGDVKLTHAIHQRKGDGAWELGKSKTRREHSISIGPRAIEAIQAQLARLDDMAAAVGVDPGPWVFPVDPTSPDTLPDPNAWSKRWASVRVQIGLPKVALHHLRHWSVAHLLAGGFDAATVAGRHSHSNPTVTLGRYAKFLKPRDIDAARHLEELGRAANAS